MIAAFAKRLRVFDVNLPRLFWLTVLWRGWADGSKPALAISLWKPSKRRRWLRVWRWEIDPEESGMTITVSPPPGEEPRDNLPPPSDCPGCRQMGQFGLRGECIEPGCNVIH
jgi:hypothetical protein